MKQKLLFTLMFLMAWGTSAWGQTAQSIPGTLDIQTSGYAVLDCKTTGKDGHWGIGISDMNNGGTATFTLNNATAQYYRVTFDAYTKNNNVTLNFTIKNGETILFSKDVAINNNNAWNTNDWTHADNLEHEFTTSKLPVNGGLTLVITFQNPGSTSTANICRITFAANTNPQTLIDNHGDGTSLLTNADCTGTTGWSNTTSSNQKTSQNYYSGTATVLEPSSGGTISQTITGLPDGEYTVQLVTRGQTNGKVKLTLNASDVDEVSLVGGNDTKGNVAAEKLVSDNLSSNNNGWKLLQGVANVTSGKLTIAITNSATVSSNWWQVSDVKVLFNADGANDATYTYKTKAESGFVDLTSTNHHYFAISGNALVKATTNTSNLPNVIVNGTCTTLKLTDGAYDFGTTEGFTATSVTYDRTFTAGRTTTVCLPFALTSAEASSLGTFYELSSFDEKSLNFTLADAPVANKPYLVVPTATNITLSESKSIVATPNDLKESVSNVDFIGTLSTTKIPASGTGADDYSYYAYNNGNFVKIVTNAASLPPFRAYFKVKNSAIAARSLNVSFDNETNSINEIANVQSPITVYDVQGRRVQNPTKGLYIVNGKKVIK